ncbi:MAG: hypothetical protein MMC33_008521 [Icmadophila ericetorum]|nr:hypothetical protein [Icmadophila ericetorum]
MATFIVPLNLNKLDLKDYLWNLYRIPCLSIRSYIQQQRVQQDKPGARIPSPRRWYRPRSIKKMTIEMAPAGKLRVREKGQKTEVEGRGGPFVWPAELKDAELEPFDKDMFDKASEAREKEQDMRGPNGGKLPPPDRRSIAEQARALLEGREQWRPSWMDFGGVRERALMRERVVDDESIEKLRKEGVLDDGSIEKLKRDGVLEKVEGPPKSQ